MAGYRRPPLALGAVEWEALEHTIKVRSGASCEARVSGWCVADERTGSVEHLPRWRVSLHHRRAKGMGGTRRENVNHPGNLMLLCGDGVSGCHGWATVGDVDEARRRGVVVPLECADPAGVPVELWSGRVVLLGHFYEQVGWNYATPTR
ncbi:hypothetical protein JNW90_24235 [Micromonospora sp. STR1s_5]|nr:hypothetical protein [Micromonospora sp. STR1s_5]